VIWSLEGSLEGSGPGYRSKDAANLGAVTASSTGSAGVHGCPGPHSLATDPMPKPHAPAALLTWPRNPAASTGACGCARVAVAHPGCSGETWREAERGLQSVASPSRTAPQMEAEICWRARQTVWIMLSDHLRHPGSLRSCGAVSTSDWEMSLYKHEAR